MDEPDDLARRQDDSPGASADHAGRDLHRPVAGADAHSDHHEVVDDASASLDVGVTGPPLIPRNVPVAEAVLTRQDRPHGVGDLDDVATLGVVVEPLRIAGADVQTTVADIAVALAADRPGRGVHVDAAVRNLS